MTTRPQGSAQPPSLPARSTASQALPWLQLQVVSCMSSPQIEVEWGLMALWAPGGKSFLPDERRAQQDRVSACAEAVMEVLAQKCP